MSIRWESRDPPPAIRSDPVAPLRILWRGGLLLSVIGTGVAVSLSLRLVERPLFQQHRPWTPHVTQWVSRIAFRILRMRYEVQGEPMKGSGAVVSNHVSWLDIFALNARKRVYFVSKSEVAGWLGIGYLARMTGTLFISRDPKQSLQQTAIFEERLLLGHKLLFFPEGSSTDGLRVLPFRSTLFQPLFSKKLTCEMHLQPVTLVYQAPEAQDPRFYGWWGDMSFGGHLIQVLGAKRQGAVKVIYHPEIRVDAFPDRKALAAHAESLVRGGMPPG